MTDASFRKSINSLKLFFLGLAFILIALQPGAGTIGAFLLFAGVIVIFLSFVFS